MNFCLYLSPPPFCSKNLLQVYIQRESAESAERAREGEGNSLCSGHVSLIAVGDLGHLREGGLVPVKRSPKQKICLGGE